MTVMLTNTFDLDTELKILDKVHIDEYVDMTSDLSVITGANLSSYNFDWLDDIDDIELAKRDVNTMLLHSAMRIRLNDFMDKEYPNYKHLVISADFIESGIHITGTLALFSDGGRLSF
jgi:hypothetical protein